MARKPEPEIKPTRATRRVLLVLLTAATNLSGYPVGKLAGVRSGRTYRILWQLESAGWVIGEEWESHQGKPLRRRYLLTPQGQSNAVRMLGLQAPDA